jgi:hypothetical protein
MSFQSETGQQFSDSYALIYKLSGSKELLYIQLHWYIDQEARLNKKQPVGIKSFTFSPSVDADSENFIKQGYEYLKTLPEFSDAIDSI